MRALVTGAAGFIGQHLVAQLDQMGHQVTAVDRRPPLWDDALQIDLLQEIPDLSAFDVVFHLAGQPGVRQSFEEFDLYLAENVLLTKRLLDAAVDADLEAFVFASSSSVYGRSGGTPRPVSPYGITKLAAEHLARVYRDSFGVPSVGLRYFTVYGPGQREDMAFSRFIRAIQADEPITLYGRGAHRRRFTFIEDVIAATIHAAGAEPGVYDVAADTPRSVLEGLSLIETALDRKAQVTHAGMPAGDPVYAPPPRNSIVEWATVDLEEGIALQVADALG